MKHHSFHTTLLQNPQKPNTLQTPQFEPMGEKKVCISGPFHFLVYIFFSSTGGGGGVGERKVREREGGRGGGMDKADPFFEQFWKAGYLPPSLPFQNHNNHMILPSRMQRKG